MKDLELEIYGDKWHLTIKPFSWYIGYDTYKYITGTSYRFLFFRLDVNENKTL